MRAGVRRLRGPRTGVSHFWTSALKSVTTMHLLGGVSESNDQERRSGVILGPARNSFIRIMSHRSLGSDRLKCSVVAQGLSMGGCCHAKK